jgi:hypothetical protein
MFFLSKHQLMQLSQSWPSAATAATESVAGSIVVTGCGDFNVLTCEQAYSFRMAAGLNLYVQVHYVIAGLNLE